jgi:hypothetical protein
VLLNARITVGAAAAMLATCIAAVAVGLFNTGKTAEMYLQISANNMNAIVHSNSKANLDKLETSARTIGRERDAISALVERDGVALNTALLPAFNRLSANGDIDALLVFDVNGVPLAQFSDLGKQIDAPVLARLSLGSKKRENGYMRLGDGNVGYGLAFPMLKGRDVVGIGVLAVDLAKTLDGLATKSTPRSFWPSIANRPHLRKMHPHCRFRSWSWKQVRKSSGLKLVVPSWRLP